MKNLVAFFEIPATDFERAVNFYQGVFSVKLKVLDCEAEKTAFFSEEGGLCPGAISVAAGFKPSLDGVLISLNVADMEAVVFNIERLGGRLIQDKTKIEAENRGYFSIFVDSEGNKIGLYSDN